jgi:hypothetical protein
MNRSPPLDPALDQRLRADSARQAVAIQRFPSRRRWNGLEVATAIAVVIAVVGLICWA